MKTSKISPDDPVLTAYALGELDAAETAEIAAVIELQPSAQQAVLEIRAAADELRIALKDEPIADTMLEEVTAPVATKKLAPVIQFPYYMVGAAAVAGVACLFALRTPLNLSNATALPARTSPQVVAAPAITRPIAVTPADQVASSNYLANAIPDGFSDLKPAPFRDAGYRLGKSIVSDETAGAKAVDKTSAAPAIKVLRDGGEVATNDASIPQNSTTESTSVGTLAEAKNETATSYELVPVAVSDVPSLDGKAAEQGRHEQLTLKIRYQPPLIDVNRKGNIVGAPASFAMTATHLKFSFGSTGFGTMLKETPQATTYEEVLSWSAVSEKSNPSKRDDFIELVKKPVNATVE